MSQFNQLKQKLTQLITSNSESIKAKCNNVNKRATLCQQAQLSFCLRWCLAHLMGQRHALLMNFSPIKLSQFRFSVRNDRISVTKAIPVASPFAANSGVYFYEVSLVTAKEMCFGWTTWGTTMDCNYKLGGAANSIGFDGLRGCIWHNAENNGGKPIVSNLQCWQIGDRLGCLIDLDLYQFVFYLNGKQIVKLSQSENQVIFHSPPYFAIATVGSAQQCRFNFGQFQFSHPPKLNFRHSMNNHMELLQNIDLWQRK